METKLKNLLKKIFLQKALVKLEKKKEDELTSLSIPMLDKEMFPEGGIKHEFGVVSEVHRTSKKVDKQGLQLLVEAGVIPLEQILNIASFKADELEKLLVPESFQKIVTKGETTISYSFKANALAKKTVS